MEKFQIHPEWPQGTAAGWALLCGWFPHRLGCPRLSFIAPNAEASAARPAARGRLAMPQGLARTLAPRINAAPGRAGQRVLGDATACDSASVTPARRRGLWSARVGTPGLPVPLGALGTVRPSRPGRRNLSRAVVSVASPSAASSFSGLPAYHCLPPTVLLRPVWLWLMYLPLNGSD